MKFLIWVGDVINSFLANLPQYAALITAGVAITLFVVKETLEIKRKKKEKLTNIDAINKIASIQGVNLSEKHFFIVSVASQIKIDSSVVIKVDYSGEVSGIKIDDNDVINIPKKLPNFSYDAILNASKVGCGRFSLFANMNDVNDYLNKSIDLFIGDMKNNNIEKLFDSVKNKKGIRKMIKLHQKALSTIENSMMKNRKYRDVIHKTNTILDGFK